MRKSAIEAAAHSALVEIVARDMCRAAETLDPDTPVLPYKTVMMTSTGHTVVANSIALWTRYIDLARSAIESINRNSEL